jgi:hypothetical protein
MLEKKKKKWKKRKNGKNIKRRKQSGSLGVNSQANVFCLLCCPVLQTILPFPYIYSFSK